MSLHDVNMMYSKERHMKNNPILKSITTSELLYTWKISLSAVLFLSNPTGDTGSCCRKWRNWILRILRHLLTTSCPMSPCYALHTAMSTSHKYVNPNSKSVSFKGNAPRIWSSQQFGKGSATSNTLWYLSPSLGCQLYSHPCIAFLF